LSSGSTDQRAQFKDEEFAVELGFKHI